MLFRFLCTVIKSHFDVDICHLWTKVVYCANVQFVSRLCVLCRVFACRLCRFVRHVV